MANTDENMQICAKAKGKRGSSLPITTDPSGMMLFGCQDGTTKQIDGSQMSGTGRRIAIVMETSTQIIPTGEPMTITRATGVNLSKLEIQPNDGSGDWVNVPLDTDTEVDISEYVGKDALIRVTRNTIDSVCTVYIFAKVITI